AQRDQPTQALSPSDLASDRKAALKLTPVSQDILKRLDAYIALQLQWQAKTNLVAASTLPQLWTRHISDSLQLLPLAPNAKIWVDLGSGGGFPGVVLACALADTPGAQVHLVERNAKKAAFLREAIRVTGGAGTVHPADIGDSVDSLPVAVDCVTARALAPLHELIAFAEPIMTRGAEALFMKGRDVEAELTQATKYWNIEPSLHPSLTGEGWIVDIVTVSRREPASMPAES
ncbi:MAG: glucose inhibited division protein, partial [Tardiphaga sp.]|nr:glucose inhibited division protein [Tardiphaga sp.]